MVTFIDLTIDQTSANVTAAKLNRLASSVLDGFQATLLLPTLRVVEDEYEKQFASSGAYFGKPWESAKGGLANLTKSGGFRDSFKLASESLVIRKIGGDNFTLRVRNRYKPQNYGARLPLMALFQSGFKTAKTKRAGKRKKKTQFKQTVVKFQISGPIGGISQAGVGEIRNVWETTISGIVRRIFGS